MGALAKSEDVNRQTRSTGSATTGNNGGEFDRLRVRHPVAAFFEKQPVLQKKKSLDLETFMFALKFRYVSLGTCNDICFILYKVLVSNAPGISETLSGTLGATEHLVLQCKTKLVCVIG